MSIHESVACPHCHKSFALSDAISRDLQEMVKEQLEGKYKANEELFQKKLQNAERERLEYLKRVETEKMEFAKRFEREKMEFAKRVEAEKLEYSKRVESEQLQLRRKLESELSSKMQEKYALECTDLKNELDEQRKKVSELTQHELELRKKQRELEAKEKQFELDMQRKLSEETMKISQDIRRQVDEETSLKMAGKDKVLEDMKRQIDDLRRRAEQGSQQLQGEVLELKIEELIRDRFPEDEVTEVKKGVRGADIEHRVMMSSGRLAGVIFAECKDVKEWGAQWPTKLKADLRDKGGDIGIIISTVLPRDVKNMGLVEGVWACTPSFFPILVTLLREQLLRVKVAELKAATPVDQKDFLFQYMTSNRFVHKVQGICEKVDTMKETLESEKRALQKNWKKRESEIEQISLYMSEMYGELEGVIGKALPRVEALELGAPDGME
jgi:hypothetical protein